jgi:RimJ/RimL family protein N-acetyltransferase
MVYGHASAYRTMNPETSEDFLDFKCPSCGALNSFPGSAANLARECMNCFETFLVPAVDGGMARTLPLPIETARLRLRRFEPTDWKDLLEFEFDDEDDATGWLLTVSKAKLTEVRQPFYLAVEARDANKVIGSLSLMFLDSELNQMDIALSPGNADTLPGWEAEAFDAALDFCFRDLKLHRVCARCDGNDSDSRGLFEKIGMRQEAEFVKNHFADGEWLSSAWFAMLEEEYFRGASA